uniref:Uncharacterized protein n=1 Tax=Cacopsylla melanoneura TaxID=428564 RepID=A0A8D9AHA6_9HEMI
MLPHISSLFFNMLDIIIYRTNNFTACSFIFHPIYLLLCISSIRDNKIDVKSAIRKHIQFDFLHFYFFVFSVLLYACKGPLFFIPKACLFIPYYSSRIVFLLCFLLVNC